MTLSIFEFQEVIFGQNVWHLFARVLMAVNVLQKLIGFLVAEANVQLLRINFHDGDVESLEDLVDSLLVLETSADVGYLIVSLDVQKPDYNHYDHHCC